MVKYITGNELAELMKSGKEPKKDFLVVDVRDDDYAGGNIKNSLNLPSSDFMTSVDGLVKKTKDVPVVIFHCSLSQVRGPKAAQVYEETRQNLKGGGSDDQQEILVLQRGFSHFQRKFKDDPELVENWDKNVWA